MYITKNQYIEDDLWFYTSGQKDSVNVCDHLHKPTGVLNRDGQKIYKAPRPIGFGRDDEW